MWQLPIFEKYEYEEREIHRFRLDFCVKFIVIPLALSFGAVDYFYAPDNIYALWAIRLSVIPFFITYRYWSSKVETKSSTFYHPSHLVSLWLGVYSALLCVYSGGVTSLYYGGLNLVVTGLFCAIPWNLRHLFITGALIYLPYSTILPLADPEFNLPYFLLNVSFMTSTLILSTAVNLFTKVLRFHLYSNRDELKKQIDHQESEIRRQTEEGVFLQKLTTQFSPQVVNGVKNGVIDIESKLKTDICCIVVDIENSTSKSLSIDFIRHTELVSDFLSKVIKLMLRNDLTVSNFTGDGVFAFSNAPISNLRYVSNVYQSALEILELRNQLKSHLHSEWQDEFNIRIGVSLGPAMVGFYPDSSQGIYTAMGSTVNLAFRLCDSAQPNSVCATQSFLDNTVDGTTPFASIQKLNSPPALKGFESQDFQLYCIRRKFKEPDLKSCPVCVNGYLTESPIDEVSSLLSCSQCKYTDISYAEDEITEFKKAS